MADIRCVRVDPPAKPSRQAVIESAIVANLNRFTVKVVENVAARVDDALIGWEADNPEPTYRIEMDAKTFAGFAATADQVRRGGMVTVGASFEALAIAILQCADEGEGTHGDPSATPNRCPGHTVTAEELAEAMQDEAAAQHTRYRPFAKLTKDQRADWIDVVAAVLARFFPEHIAHPSDPEPEAVERCGKHIGVDLYCVRPKGHGPVAGIGTGCRSVWRLEDGPEPGAES